VRVTHSDDEEFPGSETAHLLVQGHASHCDGFELTDNELQRERRKRREALRRKRPVGFAAWPKDSA
jgi:hypothetical protein